MLTHFQNYFTDCYSCEFVVKRQVKSRDISNASLHYTCEMFVLKNRHAPEPSEANWHARLSHSIQLLKNIRLVHDWFTFTDEKIFTVATAKDPCAKWPTVRPAATKKKDVGQNAYAHDWRSESHWWHQSASESK